MYLDFLSCSISKTLKNAWISCAVVANRLQHFIQFLLLAWSSCLSGSTDPHCTFFLYGLWENLSAMAIVTSNRKCYATTFPAREVCLMTRKLILIYKVEFHKNHVDGGAWSEEKSVSTTTPWTPKPDTCLLNHTSCGVSQWKWNTQSHIQYLPLFHCNSL